MRVMFGGKFENALVHELDEFNQPQRNRTSHDYYLGLNRAADREYFERLGTFLTIADEILVPVIDWSPDGPEIAGSSLGVQLLMSDGIHEWDDPTRKYAERLIARGALSPDSLNYISVIDLSKHDAATRADLRAHWNDLSRKVSVHYLCRLFLQLHEAGRRRALLILDERDIDLISQIRDYALGTGDLPPFPFPDLQGQVVIGSEFAGGVFNFSPHDMKSIEAIKTDPTIQEYAAHVRKYLGGVSDLDRERGLLEAMRKSYETVRREHQVEKAFEVISWIAKPLHYIPGVDAVVSVVEDVKDVGVKLLEKDSGTREWYLLAARAQQLDIEDYLKRKSNL